MRRSRSRRSNGQTLALCDILSETIHRYCPHSLTPFVLSVFSSAGSDKMRFVLSVSVAFAALRSATAAFYVPAIGDNGLQQILKHVPITITSTTTVTRTMAYASAVTKGPPLRFSRHGDVVEVETGVPIASAATTQAPQSCAAAPRDARKQESSLTDQTASCDWTTWIWSRLLYRCTISAGSWSVSPTSFPGTALMLTVMLSCRLDRAEVVAVHRSDGKSVGSSVQDLTERRACSLEPGRTVPCHFRGDTPIFEFDAEEDRRPQVHEVDLERSV
ncbi:hypothetical protein BAUCODRAFT_234643 [Baudoinia panamericana UAMH 10762]|uniref:Uncharacterized protein n=1 Tax=Baudoinia panamericana (strain UAMH 10762) TaxID=717646 RepID=M2N2Q5_BAUPA|nr:uncharacterized protein BAUCODRAFT_234643 [Baudoinia panamericana UAMH 10762]EMC93259.1 hypothetical protein BAUCODRAFT_234643 [Baudoinia panamericana UAMH 10762]